MKALRLLKRYPLSGGYLILILFIVYLIIFDILGSYNRELQWEKDSIRYQYPYNYRMTAFSFPKEKILEFEEQCQEAEAVNIKIENVWVSATQEAGKYGYVDALLSSSAEERYTMKEGKLPKRGAAVPEVAIGSAYEDDISYEENVPYFSVDGTRYRVSGIIESPYSDYLSKTIVMYYSDLKPARQQKIGENFTFQVQSETAPDDALNQLYGMIKELSPETNIQAYKEGQEAVQSTGSAMEERKMQWILIAFCALVLALVADFWMEDRTMEVAVKKTFGHTTWHILLMLFWELLEFMVLAMALYLVFTGGKMVLGVQEKLFLFQADMGNLWIIAGVLMTLMTAGVIIPALRTLRCQPADVLKRE